MGHKKNRHRSRSPRDSKTKPSSGGSYHYPSASRLNCVVIVTWGVSSFADMKENQMMQSRIFKVFVIV